MKNFLKINRALVAKKKLTLLFALLCASMMSWGTKYCNYPLTPVVGTSSASVTMELVSGTTYRFTLVCDQTITAVNDNSVYAHKNGADGYQIAADFAITDAHTISCEFTSTDAPRIYSNIMFFNTSENGEQKYELPTGEWESCAGGGGGGGSVTEASCTTIVSAEGYQYTYSNVVNGAVTLVVTLDAALPGASPSPTVYNSDNEPTSGSTSDGKVFTFSLGTFAEGASLNYRTYFPYEGGGLFQKSGLTYTVGTSCSSGGEDPEPETIDWSTVEYVFGSTQYKVWALAEADRPTVVGIQQPGWSEERGIYMTFPSADQLACSVSASKDGAGLVVFESNFAYTTLTEVTVTWNGGSKTFYVHNDSPITAPTTKAPTPTTALGRVRPISSQYAFNTQMSMLGWSSGMKQIDITREGSKFSCYKFGSYVGIGYGVTNVSQMNKIHMDIWTENAHTINFYLHSSGQEKAYEISLSAGSWTSVDIPLSHFDNVDLTAVDEFKFANASLADQAIFIDNIYFYADADLPNPDPSSVADTDFSLRSNGAIAYGSKRLGENYPARSIDGNDGTLWETIYNSDPQFLVVDFGQRRIFNMVKIYWGNQYAREFYLETSNNGSDWTEIKHVTENTTNHANSEQTFQLDANATARYVRFRGIVRANGYGYTIKSFSTILAGVSVLTSVDLSSDKELVKVGAYATLTASPKDQNGSAVAADLSYSVSPEDAGHVTDGKYYPDKYAHATITVTAEAGGEQVSNSVQVWGVVSDNLALNNALEGVGTWYDTATPAMAVDGNDGTEWQGSTTNGKINDSKIYDAWCVVDLKGNYSLQLITIHFEGACSDAYKLFGSINNLDWTELYSYAYPSPGDGNRIDNHTDWISTADLNNADNVRYLKFKSTRSATEWGMKIKEMAVYGTEASTSKTVSATVSPAASGSVVITAGDPAVVVESVESGTAVTFTATPEEGYDFVNWTQGDVEVATTLAHTMTITGNTALVANFEPHRTAYCTTPVTNDAGHTIYLTVTKTNNTNEYKILFEGSPETHITNSHDNIQFRLSHVNGSDDVHHFAQAEWIVDASGTGSVYTTFTAANFRAITIENTYIPLVTNHSAADVFNFPTNDATTIKWDATCTDSEAPVLAAPIATPLSGTSVRLALSATDDMAALLTYNINYKPEDDAGDGTNVEVAGAAGVTTYKNIKGLTTGVRYQFSVTVSDGTNISAAQLCYATPSMPTAPVPPVHGAEMVRSIYSDAYETALAHDFNKNTWVSPTFYIEQNLGGDHVLVYTNDDETSMPQIAWGVDNDGEQAIIAKDGYNAGGDNKGLDVRGMDYIHFDIWSAIATTYPEVTLNNARIDGFSLNGSGWQSFDLPLSSMTDEQKINVRWIKFQGLRTPNPEEIAIDNVYFYKAPYELDEDADNTANITGWVGKHVDVQVNRSFALNSGHYTLVLPFDVDADQVANVLKGTVTELRESYQKENGDLKLNFVDVTSMTAGKAYLYLPSQAVANPVFENVTIKSALVTTDTENADFIGIYAPMTIVDLQGISNSYVLGADNYLYESSQVSTNGGDMKALRAYFTLDFPAQSSVQGRRPRAMVVFNEPRTDMPTDVEEVEEILVPAKRIENGQLIIEMNGRLYNAQGQVIR